MENPSRRRVLTAGLSGAVAAALVGSRVSATTPTEPPTADDSEGTDAPDGTAATDGTGAPDSTEATEGTGAPGTTAAPNRPTEADTELLASAQGIELAARDLYAMAIDAGAAGEEDQVLATARGNHQAAADALSALIGNAAPQTADPELVSNREGDFAQADLVAVATAGQELENTLVATHTELIGQLQNLDGASRIAAILIAEAQMATVLGHLAGSGDDLEALFDNPATALTPTEG